MSAVVALPGKYRKYFQQAWKYHTAYLRRKKEFERGLVSRQAQEHSKELYNWELVNGIKRCGRR